MGLFDGYIDPQQFNSGGGLLGRLLALQKFPGQYQSEPELDQALSQAPSPASMLSPLLPSYGQPPPSGQPFAPYAAPWPMPGDQNGVNAFVNPGIGNMLTAQASASQLDSAVAREASNPSGLASSSPTRNTLVAQYSPARPGGVFVPPNVFIPGTPENDAFVHSTINAGRMIGNAVGNILNNDNGSRPPAGSRGIDKTPWSGDHTEIKKSHRCRACGRC